MNDEQLLRYSRHILQDGIGIEAQEAWLAGHALIIGAGGLGSAAAPYLASAGVGTITLIDDDCVDLTNLQRQIMHTTDRIGMAKVVSGKMSLLAINPQITVHTVQQRAGHALLDEWIPTASVVLDCSDNFATRHAINRACVRHGIPLVSGAAIRFDGQLAVFDPRQPDSPCYACLFPEDIPVEEAHCATMGVFSPLVGIIGSMQAAEALKLMAGIGQPLTGQFLLLDARNMSSQLLHLHRQTECQVCHSVSC